MKDDPLDIIMNFVSKINLSGKNMVDKANKTDYNDVLKLRMQAAERGVELTPQEVVDLIELLREAGS